MAQLTIITNNQPRDLVALADLPIKWHKEFTYITSDDEMYSPRFFQYRDWVYDSHEFMSVSPGAVEMKDWHAYSGDSFFSGTLIKFVDDCERVIVGRYYS